MEKSFYCGDAAGRAEDHSNDDLLFSINTGINFCTPEMLFDGKKEVNFPIISGIKIDEEKYTFPKIDAEQK